MPLTIGFRHKKIIRINSTSNFFIMNLKKHTFFSLLLFFLLGTLPLSAQRDFSKVEITLEELSKTVYMLTGSGGNIGVCVGEDGVFVIDSQFAPLSEKIMKSIAQISNDGQIKYLINTHWHGDHTGGNENFNKKGAVIVAHENVRTRLSKDQLLKAFSQTVPASERGAWPTITFKNDISLHANGEDIMIFHVHNAHTDGDAIVYFPKSNVLHMGDTFFKDRYPYIDLASGGSTNGIIDAANKGLMLVDDSTKIIPGHGSQANKQDLKNYRDMLVTVRDRVKAAIKEGKTLEQIKAAKLNKDYDATHSSKFITADKIVDIIYTDLNRQDTAE